MECVSNVFDWAYSIQMLVVVVLAVMYGISKLK